MTDKPLLAARKHSERPHVLIISDDPSLAMFLNEGLPLGGFWTTAISSGLQALEIFRLRQFDLVLLDHELRSFDAMELARRLRGRSDRSNGSSSRTAAPIILIGENAIDLDPVTAQDLAIPVTFHAPINLEDLAPALHNVYEEWRLHNPHTPLSDNPTRGTAQ